jgi:hypothetical protein
LVPSKAAQLIQVANLWKPPGTVKIELYSYQLCICTVQSAETDGPIGKQVHNPVNDWGLQVQWWDICHQEIPICCPYLWKRMAIDWARGNSANEWGFRPMYSMTQKLYSPLCQPTHGGLTYISSIELNVKLWPRFKISRWQSYGVMTMYNIRNLLVP